MFIVKISKFQIFLNYNINIINLSLDHLKNTFLSVMKTLFNTQFFIIIDQYIKNILYNINDGFIVVLVE